MSLIPADAKLIEGASSWLSKNKSGFFGNCARCGIELESAPKPIKFWRVRFSNRGYRNFCAQCGEFLLENQ